MRTIEFTQLTEIELLDRMKEIILNGGDPHPCGGGPYCISCLVACAKTELDEEHGFSIEDNDAPASRIARMGLQTSPIPTKDESLDFIEGARAHFSEREL